MDINGSAIVRGSGPQTLSGVAGATVGGEDGKNKQWVLKFKGGVKIQSDTVDVAANSSPEFALPEAYTEDHYTVLVSCAESLADDITQHSSGGWVPSGPNKLSHVQIENIGEATRSFTFLSIGKDL